jgi:hypothetical protein
MLILLYSTRDGYSLDNYVKKLNESNLTWYQKDIYYYDTPIHNAAFVVISSFSDFIILRNALDEELILRDRQFSQSVAYAVGVEGIEVVEIYDDCRE